MGEAPLLAIDGLVTEFRTDRGVVRAVDGVSFEIPAGRTLGVVGESGCGKSVTALSVLRLVPEPPGRIAAGSIRYRGDDLLRLSEPDMRAIRGNQISMIFQEPMTALNPVFTIGEQIAEVVRLHRDKSRTEALEVAVDMLDLVGIPAAAQRVRDYPHQLSGGMRQRAMIAMALACRPDLLIADEPTTALDVTIQAQILDLLRSLQAELGMSVMLITHDLGVIAESADEVVVMYAGRVLERAPVVALFDHPRHPYTAGLLRSVPSYRGAARAPRDDNHADRGSAPDDRRSARLQEIPGMVPSPYALPAGCKFQDRCPAATGECREHEPALVELAAGHHVRCHHPLAPPNSDARPAEAP
jgi:oligopeptide/dipeptide ABC transporter ATP-binding protein